MTDPSYDASVVQALLDDHAISVTGEGLTLHLVRGHWQAPANH